MTTVNDNHLKLMRVHIGFVVFYIIFAIVLLYMVEAYGADQSFVAVLLTVVMYFTPLICLHGGLAYGAKNKIELSRRISEIIFAIMLLGFPIGTLLSILFFLPKTTWKQAEDTP